MPTTKRMGQTARVYRAEDVLSKPSPKLWVRPERHKVDRGLGLERARALWELNRKLDTASREAGRKRCEAWAGLITTSDWWRDQGLPRRVKVGKMQRNARSSRGGWYSDGWKIRLCEWGMTPYVVLHELAHVADMASARDRSRCDHTGTYTAWLLTLVELGLGRQAARDLMASFVQHGAVIDTALWERLQGTLPEGHPAGGWWERVAARITPAVPVPLTAEPAPAPAPLAVAAKPSPPPAGPGVQGSLW